jgi:flagellar biosynthesis/type III secretory pathway ATPase
VEGDDFNEPVCDAVRSMLDGHIILSRQLGAAGHYPAIDVLNSVSRLQTKITAKEQQSAMRALREALSVYQSSEDLIQLGAYVSGANPRLDRSIRLRSEIMEFLKQEKEIISPLQETIAGMSGIAAKFGAGE